MDQFIAELKKIPPVTRFLCGSFVGVTTSVLLGLVHPYTVLFHSHAIIRKLQLWRLFTPFFIGSPGLGKVFELFMLYNTANELETKSYHLRSSDFAFQLMFVGPSIIAATWLLNDSVFVRAFLLCIIYLYSKLAPPGSTTSFFGFVTLPIWCYPYMLIGIDFLVAGPAAAAHATAGAVVGHVWWWLVWGGDLGSQGLLARRARAPEWLRRLIGESGPRVQPPAAGGEGHGLARGGIHVTAPRRPATAGSSTPITGYQWGRGQKLGN